MARSLYRLVGIGVSCCILSGCALLSSTNEPDAQPTVEAAPPATADPDDAAPADAAAETVANTEAAAAETNNPSRANYFSEGVTRAQSAVTIGQSAQSPDDWQLAASRWQQAVQYMAQVPETDPNYAAAQQKLEEYGQNLATAQKRAAGEVVATVRPASPDRPPGLIATIPVIDQIGGTPVVPVTLTGDRGTQQFTMLFDTGASGTLITQSMADAVGAIVIGSTLVTVADGRQVEAPVGYIDTLKVGDLVVQDLQVIIGGDVGLLGQNVYGDYGLSIGGSQINLYE
ncbi:MAG: retropepsin-like aspartic protease [Cyanobacteria bacterium P01_C01_bin.120]